MYLYLCDFNGKWLNLCVFGVHSILLGGVESRIVDDYTRHVALFMVFLHFF